MTDQEVPEESPTTHPGEWGTFDPSQIAEQRQRNAADFQSFQEPKPVDENAPAFDEKYKEKFTGLLYIGALTDRFDFLGHEIVIRTLTADDDLAIGEVTKEWMGTAAAERAYIMAISAMCLVSVDGQEPPIPLGSGGGGYAWAYQRFNWLKANVFSLTIDRIYQRYVALEAMSREVLEELEKAYGSSTTGQIPDASDSLQDPGSYSIVSEPADSGSSTDSD